MATLGEARVNIRANLRPLKVGLAKARGLITLGLKNIAGGVLGGITKIISNTISKLVTSIKRMLKIVAAAFIAVGVFSTKMAMEVQESENLFTVSMKGMAEATREWSNELADALTLNRFEIRKQVGVFNVMLKSMGIGAEKAAEMSKELVKLTFDLASFFDLDPAESFAKIQSGITGMVIPLKRLGILIGEESVKAWAKQNGVLNENKKTLTDVEKLQPHKATSSVQCFLVLI